MMNTQCSSLTFFGLLFASLLSSFVYANSPDSAKQAWTELVGERFSKESEFSFVENDAKLPNVLIYGDSISIHYTNTVREELSGKANLYRIHLNGGDSSSFIPKMKRMHKVMQKATLTDAWSFKWDVIHFNVGLHDLKYSLNRKLNKKNGVQKTTIAKYESNLLAIVQYLKVLAPKATLIFSTTTPIPEGEPGRIVGDADKYNHSAVKILKAFPEIKINDLHSFTKPNHKDWWKKAGDVHYNEIGRKAQGEEVARNVLSELTNK